MKCGINLRRETNPKGLQTTFFMSTEFGLKRHEDCLIVATGRKLQYKFNFNLFTFMMTDYIRVFSFLLTIKFVR